MQGTLNNNVWCNNFYSEWWSTTTLLLLHSSYSSCKPKWHDWEVTFFCVFYCIHWVLHVSHSHWHRLKSPFIRPMCNTHNLYPPITLLSFLMEPIEISCEWDRLSFFNLMWGLQRHEISFPTTFSPPTPFTANQPMCGNRDGHYARLMNKIFWGREFVIKWRI